MSGLFGVVDFAAPRIEPESFRRLAELASYRAPGGITCHFLGSAGLAHLALGERDRPLLDPQHQICVLFDGRLDNRPELIAKLSPARGPEASDTEILLAAYLEWEEACTDHLLGDFAFAIWDSPRRRLLCAVDPLGIKPLHYAQAGSLVCFASDAVQVLRHPAVPDGYNEVEIAAYLASQFENPSRSFFSAIYKLAPGHRLIVENGHLRLERYWSPNPREIRYARDEDYAVHFRELLQQAVNDRLRDAGSFVAVAMSGGLDSTSVAALAQRISGTSVRAYSFVFDRLPDCDERAYSRAMTKELGLEVEPVEAEYLWSLESQPVVPFSPDTPFMGWRTCYQEIFRRMAPRGSRVLLLGHGGDDLLRGSSLVYAQRLRRGDLSAVREVARHARSRREPLPRAFYRHFGRPHLPAGADRLLRSALRIERKGLLPSWVLPAFALRTDLAGRNEALRPQRIFAGGARQEIYESLVGVPWYWRLVNWHNRSAAAAGIEVRHPFLDRRLFEYVLAIPEEQLFRLGCSKSLLRSSMAGILPETVRSRATKTQFTSFLDFALRERATREIKEIMKVPRAAGMGMVDGERLRSVFLDFLNGDVNGSQGALWHTISLEIWLRRCEALRADCQSKAPATSRAVA
jgi:asparagine synthase (glutamine-hydrolysing)